MFPPLPLKKQNRVKETVDKKAGRQGLRVEARTGETKERERGREREGGVVLSE